jgi:hypothetical protein
VVSDEQTVLGNMHGYRSWMVFDGRLSPMIKLYGEESLWERGWNQAKCLGLSHRRNHTPPEVPHFDCMCGYWAYWTPHNKNANYLTVKSMLIVSGVVQARGNVIMQERGFRAASCRVLALAPHPGKCSNPRCVESDCCDICLINQELIAKELPELGRFYRVPVFPSFQALAAEFPPTHQEESVRCPDCRIRTDVETARHLTTCRFRGKEESNG